MSDSSKATLASIEALLVSEMANPREALAAAYQLGRLDGLSEMAGVAKERLAELLPKAIS